MSRITLNNRHINNNSNIKNNSNTSIRIAQITDCHLFGDINGLHHGVNVYNNLSNVIDKIARTADIKLIIFTGDLTQDHSELSYKRFVEVFEKQRKRNPAFIIPVYYLAGNHDEETLLDKHLNSPPFDSTKIINLAHWQLQLIKSKSDTPSGIVSKASLKILKENIQADKNQLIFMHHHPVDVGYFIDDHGLKNQDEFWQAMAKLNQGNNIKGIACGHVHRGVNMQAFSEGKSQCVEVFTCPATSIQFDPNKAFPAASDKGAGYRLIDLYNNGDLISHEVYV